MPCVLLMLVLTGCAERPSGGEVPGQKSGPTTSPTPGENGRRYEASGTVLQGRDGKPMLCLGAVALSLPPQCGDVPITNWDWDRVEDEEHMSGVTWGDYHVVGTYDGASFAVLEVGPPRSPHHPQDRIEIPCPQPEGGWTSDDLGRVRESDMDAAGELAAGQPDFAGLWVKVINPIEGVDVYEGNDIVLNVAFNGDIERHRRELAEVWGGPLCVVRHERTQAELLRIQDELSSRGKEELGIELLASDVDVVHNQLRVQVVRADDGLQEAVDERYGKGTVRLSSALKPVD